MSPHLVPTQRQPRPGGDVGDLVTQAAQAFQDFRNGVPGGIDRLVRLVTPLLWHTARQCGLSSAEAEDSVQQTFLALVRRGDTISDPMAVIRWLTVTLRRQAWRDRAVGAQRSGSEPTDDDLPREPSAESAAVLTDEQRRLWAHVSALPDRCRRLLAVIAFAPRPDYAAIAKDMGMPVGSIGPTRGRCLDKLRARLQGGVVMTNDPKAGQARSDPDGERDSESQEPMDRYDLDLLSDLIAVYDKLDPMPEMLPDVILFALDTSDLDAEMARLVESEAGLVGTRGSAQVEHARRVTFSSEHLTVMVAVEPQPGGEVRLDGWAAPGGGLRVELRSGDAVFGTECDDSGRFVFDSVPVGPAQITLYPTDASDSAIRMPVVTPAIQL